MLNAQFANIEVAGKIHNFKKNLKKNELKKMRKLFVKKF
jgi:hypothetical protein